MPHIPSPPWTWLSYVGYHTQGGEEERGREGVEVGWTKNASKGRMRGMEREKEWEYVSKLTQTNLYESSLHCFWY